MLNLHKISLYLPPDETGGSWAASHWGCAEEGWSYIGTTASGVRQPGRNRHKKIASTRHLNEKLTSEQKRLRLLLFIVYIQNLRQAEG